MLPGREGIAYDGKNFAETKCQSDSGVSSQKVEPKEKNVDKLPGEGKQQKRDLTLLGRKRSIEKILVLEAIREKFGRAVIPDKEGPGRSRVFRAKDIGAVRWSTSMTTDLFLRSGLWKGGGACTRPHR